MSKIFKNEYICTAHGNWLRLAAMHIAEAPCTFYNTVVTFFENSVVNFKKSVSVGLKSLISIFIIKGNCQSAKKIYKIFLKFSFIVALHGHFLLQIDIFNFKGIRKHALFWKVGRPALPLPHEKGSADPFGRLTFFHKSGKKRL